MIILSFMMNILEPSLHFLFNKGIYPLRYRKVRVWKKSVFLHKNRDRLKGSLKCF